MKMVRGFPNNTLLDHKYYCNSVIGNYCNDRNINNQLNSSTYQTLLSSHGEKITTSVAQDCTNRKTQICVHHLARKISFRALTSAWSKIKIY